MTASRQQEARRLFQQAYECQMRGELEAAVDLYLQSIDAEPTAEAYTFLGWTYHFMGRNEDAIEECKKAIAVDPEFGNPYNDIGAYLIEMGRPKEALPWLERALQAPRYDAYHFAWFNLARAYMADDAYTLARKCAEKALEVEPRYKLAAELVASLKRLVQ